MGGSRIISKYTVCDLYSRSKQLHSFDALVFCVQSCLRSLLICSSLIGSESAWATPLQITPETDTHLFEEQAVEPYAIAFKPAPVLDEILNQTKADSAYPNQPLDIRLLYQMRTGVGISQPQKEVPLLLNPSSRKKFMSLVGSRRAVDLASLQSSQSLPGLTNVDEPTWVIATSGAIPLFDSKTQEGKISSNSLKQQPSIPLTPRSANLLSSSIPPDLSILATDPGAPVPPPVPACPNPDPELGCLFLQDPIFPTNPPPVLYLVPRIDFFRSDNILLGIDPVNDGLIRPTLTLLAVPPLGRNTYLIASVEGAFNRYFNIPRFNYDELRIRAGISQRLSPTMWGEIGWTNQQLFISGNKIPGFPSGVRFLNDQALRFELSRRDQFNNKLFLTSLYQLRLGFANPSDRSRILNVLYLSLGYDLQPTVQLGIDYQLAAANYTVVQRTDFYHQLLGRLTISAFRNTQLSLYGGLSFGSSTAPGISFDSYILGVSMSVNLVLF